MQAPVSLQRVMAFEQRIDPGEFVLSPWRVPMWSVVRSYIAGALYDSIAGTGFQKKGGARVRPGAAFFYRTWAGRHGTSPARQPVDIVYIATGGGNIYQEDQGRYFNWITDYCAQAVDARSQVVELNKGWAYPRPRVHPDVSTHHDWIALRAQVAARRRRLPDTQLKAIDHYLQKLRAAFGDTLLEGDFAHMRRALQVSARSAAAWHDGYQRFFEARRPKLLQINGASYGGVWAYVTRWARAAGIPVAEFQHGYIGHDHYAYNYAPNVATSAYREGLPDYLLTFGQYWADAICTPSQTVVIGSPRMSEPRAVSPGASAPYILLASTGVGPEFYLSVVQGLLRGLPPGGTVRFRPHPGERHVAVANYAALLADARVSLDTEPDVYRSMAGAALVVGDITTLMFEAIGLGVPTRVIDCEIARHRMPTSLFQFLDYDEIPVLLDSNAAVGQPDAALREQVWAPDWRSRYQAFVARFL